MSDFDGSQVFGYIIDSSGRLIQVTSSPFPAGGSGPGFKTLAVLPNQGPHAAFSTEVHPVRQPVRFDATRSADPDGTVARYDWDLGDGTHTTGPTPAHRYTRAGTFQVTLTVTDNEGCSAQLIFTGQSALCNGTLAARTAQTITIPQTSG